MKNLFLLCLLCAGLSCFAQTTTFIQLSNPSMEDFAEMGRPPFHWYDCGFTGETPPDVQPDPTFNVMKPAQHGETYLGMVVRDNETWETVSQRLSKPLERGKCYALEIWLAKSPTYMSVSRVTGKAANYVTPVRLRIWGGYGHCDKHQLLAETGPVIHTNWKAYDFQLAPEGNYSYFMLEACYDEEKPFAYNGNILVDHLSNLKVLPCNPGQAVPEEVAEEEIAEVITTPVSATELTGIVEASAPRITFNAFGSIERSPYVDGKGQERLVNLPLFSIVEGIKQHPLATLIITIAEKDPDLAEKKKESLETLLSQMKAWTDQVVIRQWQENDAGKTWYGNAESGVLVRLIL